MVDQTSAPVVHVIDDDEAARESLAFLLDCAGRQVRTYPSAVAFLAGVATLSAGIIVTDVRMPEMNGLELVTRLKALGIRHPVIVITGHADVPLAIQAMKAGVADFIEKPFGDATILDAIEAALLRESKQDALVSERDRILARIATLSPRESEVLDELVQGCANKVIAHKLSISARTVEVYRANVMTKLNAASLSELVKMVMIAKLVTPA